MTDADTRLGSRGV